MTEFDDDQFEHLVREAGTGYRTAPEPRTELMWQRIEARAFQPSRGMRWGVPLALAAMLTLGLGAGYWAGRRAARPETAERDGNAAQTARLAGIHGSPFVGVASDYLQQMTGLLVAIAGDLRTGQVPAGTVESARGLLSTTRLLLDSGVTDPRFRDLLEDLELVLAQVVHLRDATPAMDAALIAQALDQREVLPRLTSYITDVTAQ